MNNTIDFLKVFYRSLGCTLVEMLTCQPPHADFWIKHKERAQFLFIEQALAEPEHQLQYIGDQLVPDASASVQKLLDCIFIKDVENRPRSEDIVGVFACDSSAPACDSIDPAKLAKLQHRIREEQKYNAFAFRSADFLASIERVRAEAKSIRSEGLLLSIVMTDDTASKISIIHRIIYFKAAKSSCVSVDFEIFRVLQIGFGPRFDHGSR
jgi:serine/threonine protein kinase